MIRVISSFADGPVNFHSTGPAEDQIQKLISSTAEQRNLTCKSYLQTFQRYLWNDLESCQEFPQE